MKSMRLKGRQPRGEGWRKKKAQLREWKMGFASNVYAIKRAVAPNGKGWGKEKPGSGNGNGAFRMKFMRLKGL